MLIFWEKTDTIQKNTEALLDAGKEVGLEVNSEKTKYMLMSRKKAGKKAWHEGPSKAWQSSNIWEQHYRSKLYS
jgi:hypothetical protein